MARRPWRDGVSYFPGQRLWHNGRMYVVKEAHIAESGKPPGENTADIYEAR
jgi:hypothetical protein